MTTTHTTTDATTPLITIRQAALKLACCEETVRRLIRRGRAPAVRIGSVYRVRLADVEAALAVGRAA